MPVSAHIRLGLRKTIFLLGFLLLSAQLFATHLVGGSVTYKYKGKVVTSNGVRYKYDLTFAIYRDCTSSTDYDASISVGVYENLIDKESNSMKLYQEYTPQLLSANKSRVQPFNGGSKCAGAQSACLEQAFYYLTLELPYSDYGWHVQYIRCCRNNAIVNILQNQGQTFYAFIPPTRYNNSSPTFSDVPVPYLCARDTVSLVNSAYETDGDSLVYSLAWPNAGADQNFPAPVAPGAFITPSPIQYATGYSFNKPFGSGGYASIDPQTGITKIYAPNAGHYELAFDIYEYRNGNLINVTRRDIQIIVATCKPNIAPIRVPVNGNMQSTFYVMAGTKLSFDVAYTDDSLMQLSAVGDIVDSNSTITPKGHFSNTLARGKLSSTFTWQTTCDMSRSTPYNMVLKVADDDCYSKTTTNLIQIYVTPFKGTDKLRGPLSVCEGKPGSIYTSAKNSSSSRLVWKVKGGKIYYTGREDSIVVVWGNYSDGVVKVTEVSVDGCPSDTVIRAVKINVRPRVKPILGPAVVCNKSAYIYHINQQPGYEYYWFLKGGTRISVPAPVNDSSNSIEVFWDSPDDTVSISMVYKDSLGCLSDTSSLFVVINRPIIDSIFGNYSVCPNARDIDYWVKSQTGSAYKWMVSGGTISSGQGTSHVRIDWGEQGSGLIRVVETTVYGCRSDTISLGIVKDYILYTSAIRGDSSVCEFTKKEPYEVTYSNGSTYDWQVSGGTLVSGNGTARVLIDWEGAGSGLVYVTETAFDSINKRKCKGKPVLLKVRINPLPKTSAIAGNLTVCEKDTGFFQVTGYPGSTYTWQIDSNQTIIGQGTDKVHIIFPRKGTFNITVSEMTRDSCTSIPVRAKVIVYPLPNTSEITGPSIVCYPHLEGNVYSVQGYPNSYYDWQVSGGRIVSGSGTSKITVDWTSTGRWTLSVRESSAFGCNGELKTKEVVSDSLYYEITRVTTGRQNDRQIEIYWKNKNTKFLRGYTHIYRSTLGQDFYEMIDSVPSGQYSYIDTKVMTGRHAYRYVVGARNMCDEELLSPAHRSILLSGGHVADSTENLHWTPYMGWPNGVEYYNVYRSMNDDTTLRLRLVSADSSSNVIASMDGYRQCYRLEALKRDDKSVVSWSNLFCFEYDPVLFIPNAFTPGDADRINPAFHLVAYNYKTFQMTIYNRWGERIFHTDNPGIEWDGTFKGALCPQDVYVYLVNMEGITRRISAKGTIQLLR